MWLNRRNIMSKESIIDEEQDDWQWVMYDRCFGVLT